ncbi:MAG: hypothetical protein JXA67_01790 [Micromonosporaceae bacterium]|nr:hypothetical protein [Micromonosporaceae bacterium]
MVALSVAVLAVLVAIGALLVAWRALDQANDAREIALAGRGPVPSLTPTEDPAQPEASTGPQEGAATVPGSAQSTAVAAGSLPPTLDPQTVYKVKYEKQSLTLKPNPMYADLDEPRANVDPNDYDIGLYRDTSGVAPYFRLGEDVQAGEASAAAMTPQDCADRIRTAPVGQAPIPARSGAVLCVMTSYESALKRGDVQRMVLLEVTGVGADDAVTIQLTAWNIPR